MFLVLLEIRILQCSLNPLDLVLHEFPKAATSYKQLFKSHIGAKIAFLKYPIVAPCGFKTAVKHYGRSFSENNQNSKAFCNNK
jgi:hypothetical protein